MGNIKKTKKLKSISEFAVVPDKPYHHYLAGEAVTGHVKVDIQKAVRFSHLVVTLHGHIDVRTGSSLPDIVPDMAVDMTTRAGRAQTKPGLVNLFQTSQTLSGDRYCQPSKMQFQFNIAFPANIRLPSTLVFERGSIVYFITAVLTRLPESPKGTSIVQHNSHRIDFLERVDIGTKPVPRPVNLYIEPLLRNRKGKGVASASGSESFLPGLPLERDEARSHDIDLQNVHVSFDDASSIEHVARTSHVYSPSSHIPSDRRSEVSMSIESTFSSSTAARSVRSCDPFPWTVPPSRISLDQQTITATFTLQRAGFLPGQTIPIQCWVQHVRPITSARGLVVTLYRESRLDTSKGNRDRGDTATISEDSWTGLSGFGISSGGSVSRFRKELCQTYCPIYFDLNTFAARVVPVVKVPANAFPTLKSSPSDIVRFTYYAEILLDLDGRMSKSLQNAAQGSRSVRNGGGEMLLNDGCLERWSEDFWDTNQLRRVKGTISIRLPIIIGTMDSSRLRNRSNQPMYRQQYFDYHEYSNRQGPYTMPSLGSWDEINWSQPSGTPHKNGPYQYSGYEDGRHASSSRTLPVEQPVAVTMGTLSEKQFPLSPEPPSYTASNPHRISEPQRTQFPSEKEAIQQAENALLPSCPDDVGVVGPSTLLSAPPAIPSAPTDVFPEESAFASAPALEDSATLSRTDAYPPIDDKQELERRRLMYEASAPDSGSSAPPSVPIPSAPEDIGDEHDASWMDTYPRVSAPFMENDHQDGCDDSWRTAQPPKEPLPQYER